MLQDKPAFDSEVEVAVIPPYPFLALTAEALSGTAVALGAQVGVGAWHGAHHAAGAPWRFSRDDGSPNEQSSERAGISDWA